MKPFIALVTLAAASAWAQPALTPPHLGFIADSRDNLRPVYGIAGNFVVGAPAASGAISAAFSGSCGLLKTDKAVVAFDPQGKTLASIDAPAGAALFAFAPSGDAALIYVAGTLIRYGAGRFIALHTDSAEVIAVAWPDSLIVQRGDGLWKLSLVNGTVRSQIALNGVTAPVLALPSGELVSGDAHGFVLTKPDGSQVLIAAKLPARFSLQQLGDGWVGISDAASPARFALRVTPGREGFYRIPEAR